MKTAQQAAAKYQASAGAGATAWQEGINGYNGDWVGATTRQESVLVNNFNQAISRGDWRRGIEATGTGGWKTAAQAKASNYSSGVQQGVNKFTTAIGKIIAAEGQLVNSLPPRGTFEQNLERSRAMATGLHALKGQLGAK